MKVSGEAITILQHVECEDGGWFEDLAVERGLHIERVRLYEGDVVPHPRAVDALVVMGGPMGARDDHDHPWLAPERDLIAAVVGDDKPYWGVCLGAQLLAAALGSAVVTGPQPEVGISAVTLQRAAAGDAVFRHAPHPLVALHWHADTFDVPPAGVLLARTDSYPQAFRVRRAWGLQFHIESSRPATARWLELPEYESSLAATPGGPSASTLLEELGREERALRSAARRLFNPWLDMVCEPAPRSSPPDASPA